MTVSNGYYKWDHHAKVFESLSDRYLPELDRAFSALIEDLHQRGMLESTLVIMTGEFGRTPEVNVNAGRDHWPNVFSLDASREPVCPAGKFGAHPIAKARRCETTPWRCRT